MVAEFVFTPTESKHLIAKAVAALPQVKKALENGIVALHPSTTTYYILKELTGEYPDVDKVWVTGMIVPKGQCVEAHTQLKKSEKTASSGLNKMLANAGTYAHTYVIVNGKRTYGWVLNDLTERMGPGDIYIKGVNGMDAYGKVAVQIGSVDENGTIGRMVAARAKNGFEILAPTGLEKFVPGSLMDAARFVNKGAGYSTGVKARLYPFEANVITEIDALESLTNVTAVQFSAGGVSGAEGAVSIAVEGTEEQVNAAIALAESVKGSQLPAIYSPQCLDCSMPSCHLCGELKPWVKEG